MEKLQQLKEEILLCLHTWPSTGFRPSFLAERLMEPLEQVLQVLHWLIVNELVSAVYEDISIKFVSLPPQGV